MTLNENQKTEMRNYCMFGGFFIMTSVSLLGTFSKWPTPLGLDNAIFSSAYLLGATLLIILGIVLLAMKKRDLTAITFFMYGTFQLYFAFTQLEGSGSPVTGARFLNIFYVIFALIILTSKDDKKYLLSLLIAITGISGLLMPFIYTLNMPIVERIFMLSAGVVSFYYMILCASEKINLPGRRILIADATTDFKDVGSTLGYMLFALSTSVWGGVYLFGIDVNFATLMSSVCGLMLIFSGVILFIFGKMRFTPIMFILIGFLVYLSQYITGTLYIIFAIMFIILGFAAALRNESRLIPAVMLILYGLTYVINFFATTSMQIPVLAGVSNFVVVLISIYLAFAVFSKKLPLF